MQCFLPFHCYNPVKKQTKKHGKSEVFANNMLKTKHGKTHHFECVWAEEIKGQVYGLIGIISHRIQSIQQSIIQNLCCKFDTFTKPCLVKRTSCPKQCLQETNNQSINPPNQIKNKYINSNQFKNKITTTSYEMGKIKPTSNQIQIESKTKTNHIQVKKKSSSQSLKNFAENLIASPSLVRGLAKLSQTMPATNKQSNQTKPNQSQIKLNQIKSNQNHNEHQNQT